MIRIENLVWINPSSDSFGLKQNELDWVGLIFNFSKVLPQIVFKSLPFRDEEIIAFYKYFRIIEEKLIWLHSIYSGLVREFNSNDCNSIRGRICSDWMSQIEKFVWIHSYLKYLIETDWKIGSDSFGQKFLDLFRSNLIHREWKLFAD